MKKISTLFNILYVNSIPSIKNQVRGENSWINDEGVKATRKFDGSACAIVGGVLYKRWSRKKGKGFIPVGAIDCQEGKVQVTAQRPYWVPCVRERPEDVYFWEGYDNLEAKEEGTYELCGERAISNPEEVQGHQMIKHGSELVLLEDFEFETIKKFLRLKRNNIEGIVFRHPDGRMCKIRKCDFGVRR